MHLITLSIFSRHYGRVVGRRQHGGIRQRRLACSRQPCDSILVYMMGQLARGWTQNTLVIHLGEDYTQILGPVYVPIVEATCVVLVFWLFCYWLYRQKIFLRI